MSKKRVHELAKELGIDNKEIITRMEKLGIAVKSHQSTLEDADVDRITRELRSKDPQGMVEERIKSTVIRRRTVRTALEETQSLSEEALEPQEPAITIPEEPVEKPAKTQPGPVVEAPAPVEPAPVAAVPTPAAETVSEEKPAPQPEKKTLPIDTAAPIKGPADTTGAERKVEKKVAIERAVEDSAAKTVDKPGMPVRKPGVPYRTEGRKPLPEERRRLEGPKVVIPPKEIRPEPPKERRPESPPGDQRSRTGVMPSARAEGAGISPRTEGAYVPRPRPQTAAPADRKDDRSGTVRPYVPPPGGPRRDTRPGASVPKVLVPPPPEKVWKEEPARFKGKVKKQPEPALSDQAPIKKKLAVGKIPDLREVSDDLEGPERPSRWREERKSPAVKTMKKTTITTPKAIKRRVKVSEAITVGELAKKMGVKAGEVISKLIALGLMVSINQPIDRETATIIAADFSFQIEPATDEYDDLITPKTEPLLSNLKTRAPVVTIMGHVDHGKTSLLDAIRQTNVIDGEAGGITQAIGAYHVQIKGRDIVFLDTPGHEAFTAMRARGAQVTDIVVLVVAADDGVKEQTIEAINHARVAGVPILVAVNKIDKPGADTAKIKQAMTEYNLLAEEWGGDTIFCEVSAKKKQGIEELLEMILLQADIMDLKADPDRPARGVIIEAELDRGRGPVATVLIQEGTLREGDAFVSKTEFGRVRALNNDQGKRVKEAGPSMPVEVIGFSGVPQVGSEFVAMDDEKKARAISETRIRREREKDLVSSSKITLEQLYEKIREGVKDFNVIIKGDVQGSVEALSESLRKLSDAEVKLKIIHASTGAVTETDVMLASASNAIIIGFNVRPDGRVAELAEQEGIEIKLYDIIYNAIADVKAAMEGSLDPIYKEVVHGRAEVRNTFKVPKIGTVAGCYINEGKIARSHRVRLIRDGVVVYSGKIHSLKRFKDDVKEVLIGFECGISIEGFNDIKVGDAIEGYLEEQVERSAK